MRNSKKYVFIIEHENPDELSTGELDAILRFLAKAAASQPAERGVDASVLVDRLIELTDKAEECRDELNNNIEDALTYRDELDDLIQKADAALDELANFDDWDDEE